MASWLGSALSRTLGWFRTPRHTVSAPAYSTPVSAARDSGLPQESDSESEYESDHEMSPVVPTSHVTPKGQYQNTFSVPVPGPTVQGQGEYSPVMTSQGHFRPEPMTKRSSMKVDQYNGQADLLDYLQHFERVSKWNGWSADDKAMQLAMALSGDARMVLTDLPAYVASDFNMLVKALRQRFCPEGHETAYKAEFRRRTRKTGETVREYGYALRRLAARAFPFIPQDAREEWILDQFLAGLSDTEEKRHVQFAHPHTVEEAITLADEYEGFYSKPRKPTVTAPVTKGENVADLKVAIEQLQKKVDDLQRPKGRYNNKGHGHGQGQGRRPIRCYGCDQEGHIIRDCPEKRPEGTVEAPVASPTSISEN